MGVSLSWVGIQAMSADEVHAKLGLTGTGAIGDFYDFPLGGLMLPSGWYLLAAKRCDHVILSDRFLREVSAGSTIVACSIEEHVMYQSAAFWDGGREIWSVQHRGGDCEIMDLVVKGSPPDTLRELHARHLAEQEAEGGADADVDYIAEIPLELARSITGFKHDAITPGIDGCFRELRMEAKGFLAGTAKPGWKFW